MNRRWSGRRRVVAALAALALGAVGCGGGGSASDAASGDVNRDAELSFAISYGFNSLDPHRSPVPAGDYIFMRPLYDQLLSLETAGDGVELAPELATSWETSPDGMSIEFELRDGVTFQDGATFDADAVRANIERAQDADSTVRSLVASIESVEVVDPTHVVLHLERPDPAVPWVLATTPAGMMVSPEAMDNDDLATAPVGSGPWRLVSAVKDGDSVYERWVDHWDPDAALVRRLTISTISDANARYNGTRSDEYDCAYMSPPLDGESQALADEGFHWNQTLAPIAYGILLNTAMEPTDDPRVRRAISMAINRREISEELLDGRQPPAYQPFLEGYLGHDPSLDEEVYDPEGARALVREAGAEGATLRFEALTNEPQNSLAQVVQESLADIGLNVELQPVSPTEYVPSWLQGDKHGQVSLLEAYAEPSQTLEPTYIDRYNLGEPPAELVAMAREGLQLPVGSAERERHYQDISAYLVANPIHVPIVQFSTTVLCRPEVVGSENLVKMVIGQLDAREVGVASS